MTSDAPHVRRAAVARPCENAPAADILYYRVSAGRLTLAAIATQTVTYPLTL